MLQRLRSAARGALRGWAFSGDGLEAGRSSRRMSGWLPGRDHVNTIIAASGPTALARSRYLVRNNPYAAGATECFTSNLIGAGIVPTWRSDRKADLQALWQAWADEADAENVTDLYGLMRRIGRELFIAGECFVRRRPRYLTDGLSVPLQLQILPSEMLPTELTQDLGGGNRIRQGIEFNAIGKRVAYHFWRVHPGDVTERAAFGDTVRIPASEVLHVFDPVEAGQIRGLPRLTPAIVALWMLDGYDDAEMERKRTAALFTAFVKRADPDGELFDKAAEEKAKSGDGVATVTLEPGKAQVLFPGEDIVTAAPADVGANYEAFQYRSLTRVCAALGLPYAGVTGDMVRANYSNQRAALIDVRNRMEALQFGCVVHQFCRPVAKWFLDAAVLGGAIDLEGYVDAPKRYLGIDWIPPKWVWIDPYKDAMADIKAIRSGIKTWFECVAERGRNPQDVIAEILAFNKLVDEGKIVLDSDPRKTSNAGLTQAKPEGSKLPSADLPEDEELAAA